MICQIGFTIEELATMFCDGKIAILSDRIKILGCPCCGREMKNADGSTIFTADLDKLVAEIFEGWGQL